jgi:hypothetical protein
MAIPRPVDTRTDAVITPAAMKQYESRVKLITVSLSHVANTLVTCQEHEVTITGLLHGLTVTSLTSHVLGPQSPELHLNNSIFLTRSYWPLSN